MSDDFGDPLARRFDRLLALTGYGLLFISVFTLWIPALIAAAIAFTHRRGADAITESHFRFQLAIFWWSILLVVGAIVCLAIGGGFAIGALWAMATEAAPLPAGATAGMLAVGGLVLLGLSAAWTLLASAWGALRLASDRSIGQSAPGRALEPR